MHDPVVVIECRTGTGAGTWWVAECETHAWFKEVSSDAYFAERHAERHRATYHKEARRD